MALHTKVTMRYAISLILLLTLGCHSAREQAVRSPSTHPIEPIGVTVTKGDFIVVGRQDKGIAVYLTIDRRERTCLIEVQNATDSPIPILDSFTESALYRGFGFQTNSTPSTSPSTAPWRAAMVQLFPSQVLRGSLSFPDALLKQQINFRLYFEDPQMSKWIDVQSPEFEISR